jgi:hypothetical protein
MITKKQRISKYAYGEDENGGNQQVIRGFSCVVSEKEWEGVEIKHSMHHRG